MSVYFLVFIAVSTSTFHLSSILFGRRFHLILLQLPYERWCTWGQVTGVLLAQILSQGSWGAQGSTGVTTSLHWKIKIKIKIKTIFSTFPMKPINGVVHIVLCTQYTDIFRCFAISDKLVRHFDISKISMCHIFDILINQMARQIVSHWSTSFAWGCDMA